MGTIRICDWTKRKLTGAELAFKLSINGNDYEICAEALKEIKGRLDADTVPLQGRLQPQTPPPPPPAPPEDLALNAEAVAPFGDKVEASPLSDPIAVAPAPIAIPASIKEKLPIPTPAQSEAVIKESRRFHEGGLSSLNPGKQRNVAQQKLDQKEVEFKTFLERQKEKIQ